ncbi:hypothetical protein PF010_g28092 [Phytophthora fragariae]|uniref:Uncharacterized protein n=1 Tax=Phytophthora fragariae TaxID=53985 RepID=A0A6G0JS36_9STRA|nr:hypothetical protein PF010_g28092 [Phytophthora fragariae]KAE9169017.1 hypothetical protein PF004_g28322 [Phytophthora fragariae]
MKRMLLIASTSARLVGSASVGSKGSSTSSSSESESSKSKSISSVGSGRTSNLQSGFFTRVSTM